MTRIAILGAGPIGLEAALAAAARGDDFVVFEAAAAGRGPRAPLGSRAHVHALGDERLAADARGAAGRAARRRRCRPAPSSPTSCSSRSPRCRRCAGASGSPRGSWPSRGRACSSTRRSVARAAPRGPSGCSSRRPDGGQEIVRAEVVIDATGTYGNPNRLGDGGIEAVNERAFEDRIDRFLPAFAQHAESWAGRTILLTGAGHSAQTAARELAVFARDAPGTRVVWAVRNAGDGLGGRRRRPAAGARVAQRGCRTARRRCERCAAAASRIRDRGPARAAASESS